MKHKNKFEQVDIKIFIIPFIIITLILFLISHITINGIKNAYYNHIKEDSINLAKNYSHSLSKGTEAYDVVNELLEEKVLVASRASALYDGHYSNELLAELADILKVDEIDYYNSQGELVYSNMVELIGWKAYEGHPVHDFMTGDNISFIGDIRQDSITGNYFKYGYFKVSDGAFIQIGVMADKIRNLLDAFEMQKLIDEMGQAGVVTNIYFIDNDFNVVGSTEKQLIGQRITKQETKDAILESKEYGFIDSQGGEKKYEVFVPVYFEKSKIGTLATRQSLRGTDKIVNQIYVIGIVTLIIISASLLYIMISTYIKNGKLIQLAYYDTLTGLPNKQYLKDFLSEEIEKKEENEKALLLVNCNNFSIVNLIYGYDYGDELLKKMSKKIQEVVDENKKLFRFSADKFVLYAKNYDGQEDLLSIAQRIKNIFNKPFKVRDVEKNLGVQIGIVEFNNRYDNVDQLLKDASISLNNIENNDSANHSFFNEEMERRLQREEMIEKELRTIILRNDTNKLYLEFQPQVDLKTNKITCFEALARMKSESLGYISPIEFIDVAERKQLIIPLGKLILKTACDFIRTLTNEGYGDVKVAVNISGIQLLREDFTDTVMDIVKEAHIEKSNLELEITESVLLDNYEIINEKLKTLRVHNIGIALDDFGTGYSSFSRIRDLNIDTVKIDRYFISKLSIKKHSELITGDIISMSHKLGLRVVAEGVEIVAQKEYLLEHGCDILQGYLFSKPLSGDDALQMLKKNEKELL